MNLILTGSQHNFDFHMDHNSATRTNIIGSIFNSDKVVLRWWEIEMHYIIHGNELSIPCTCKPDTPSVNLHSNIQHTEWQTEPDLAAAPATVLENLDAAVAALIKIPLLGPREAAATMIIKTPAPVAMGLTPMKMAYNSANPGAIMAVTRAQKPSRWVIAITMMMNHDPHVEEPAYWITVVILPV